MALSQEFKDACRAEIKRNSGAGSRLNSSDIDKLLQILTGNVLDEWVDSHTKEYKTQYEEVRKAQLELNNTLRELKEEEARTVTLKENKAYAEVVALYSALIDTGRGPMADPNTVITEAAYIIYAMFTGNALSRKEDEKC